MIKSAEYWNKRYNSNRNSGDGSYGQLAEFKASIINNFVADNDIKTAIEFGCGDGNQLKLSKYPSYIGYDVSNYILDQCRKIFTNDSTKKFYHISKHTPKISGDLTLSLDVIFHLVEDIVFDEYMTKLFQSSNRYVIIYSSNDDQMKSTANHVRHRKFSDSIDHSTWSQIQFVKNKYPFDQNYPNTTSFSDFYFYEKNLFSSSNSI